LDSSSLLTQTTISTLTMIRKENKLEHLDYETSKAVEQQLDTFIEKRAREKADANRVEELWG
jgi:Fe-S cluster biosynthesis and repair protein YggX